MHKPFRFRVFYKSPGGILVGTFLVLDESLSLLSDDLRDLCLPQRSVWHVWRMTGSKPWRTLVQANVVCAWHGTGCLPAIWVGLVWSGTGRGA